jgi:hypothetical protein
MENNTKEEKEHLFNNYENETEKITKNLEKGNSKSKEQNETEKNNIIYTIIKDFQNYNVIKDENLQWKLKKSEYILKINGASISKNNIQYYKKEVSSLIDYILKNKLFYKKTFFDGDFYFISNNTGYDILFIQSNQTIKYSHICITKYKYLQVIPILNYFFHNIADFEVLANEEKKILELLDTNDNFFEIYDKLEYDDEENTFFLQVSFTKTKGSNCYFNFKKLYEKDWKETHSNNICYKQTKRSNAIIMILKIFETNFSPADLYSIKLYKNDLKSLVCSYFK